MSLAERFWAKVRVSQPDECWIWLANKNRGYGRLGSGDRDNHLEYAHRVSWQLANGPIPDGLNVLHKCDNPSCVNPEHLFLGTQLENIADRTRKGRSARLCGEMSSYHKLTARSVETIRALAKQGVSQFELAERFGVTRRAINYVINRKTWQISAESEE